MPLGTEPRDRVFESGLLSSARRCARGIRRFLGEESGASLIEHALLMVLLSLLIALTLVHIGSSVRSRFSSVSSCLTASSAC